MWGLEKIGKGLKGLGGDFEKFAMMEVVSKAVPFIKKLLPKVEESMKGFFKEKECIVVIKQQANGDIVVAIAKKELSEVKFKEGAICKDDTGKDMVYSFNEFAEMFTSGALEKIIKEASEE